MSDALRRGAAETLVRPGAPSVWTPTLVATFGIIGLSSLVTANPSLSLASIAVAALLVHLLWRPGEPPVLLFAVGFQWLEVSLKLWHANVLRIPIEEMEPLLVQTTKFQPAAVPNAIGLGLLGLVCLAVGMRLAIGRLRPPGQGLIRERTQWMSDTRIFWTYLVLASLSFMAPVVGVRFPAFRQPLLALADIRWAFFFVLGFLVLSRRKARALFVIAVAIEIVTGFGFFSDFKTPLFLSLIVMLTVGLRLNAKTIAISLGMIAILAVLGSAWSAVKNEYRAFLSGGTGQQIIVVSRKEQVEMLRDLAFELKGEDLVWGFGKLVNRISYVDLFAAVMEYVPSRHPHTNGELWGAAIKHTAMPRMFFPNKPPLPYDSEVTMKYTGLKFSTSVESTSISMGYMSDSYIDFGYRGLWVPVFFLGVFWGSAYRLLLSHDRLLIFGQAFAAGLFVYGGGFGTPGSKIFSGVLLHFLVFYVILVFVIPFCAPFWRQRQTPRARPSSLGNPQSDELFCAR
jgi:hypothetical protein